MFSANLHNHYYNVLFKTFYYFYVQDRLVLKLQPKLFHLDLIQWKY